MSATKHDAIANADAHLNDAALPLYSAVVEQRANLLDACLKYLADRAEAGCTADSAAVKAMRAAVAKATGGAS